VRKDTTSPAVKCLHPTFKRLMSRQLVLSLKNDNQNRLDRKTLNTLLQYDKGVVKLYYISLSQGTLQTL